MDYFFNVLIILFFDCIVTKWMPDVNFQPDFNQFQIYQSNSFQNVIYPKNNGKLPRNFEWQTIGSVTLPSVNMSYIVYGGSQKIDNNISSAFTKNFSAVVLCKLSLVNKLFSENVKCEFLKADDNNFYLGAAVKAISISKNEAVIVYCDPLWHAKDKIQPSPSGKCYLQLITDDKFRKFATIKLCQLNAFSYSTCLGGFSVDLMSVNDLISGIEMIIGVPHLIPYGGVKIVKDPFGSMIISNPRKVVGMYYNFGYAVSMTSNGIPYVSSPLSDQYGPNVTDIRDDIQITSPDNDPFSSFGLALTTLKIERGRNHAIVIGAPFHTVKSIQNVGKVYLFCSNKDHNIPSATIFGHEKDEFLGYYVANIGDINADGNDDLAISSPFLNNNDTRGFVTIYTINKYCEVSPKPHQILKSSNPQKVGIYGIAISGGSDMDFNGWPDIIVASTQSNTIELYASRQQYVAKCSTSISSNYELQTLIENEIITIKIFLTLLDFRDNSNIDTKVLEKFKLISQIDPNFNVVVDRFELHTSNISVTFTRSAGISIVFSIKSLQHIRDMNLTNPINVAFRLVENCEIEQCNNLLFPIIHWEKCLVNIPVRKYICSITPACDADLAVELYDENGKEVIYNFNKSFHRSVKMKIYNFGPSDAKDINFKILTFQNLRINKISITKETYRKYMKDIISPNQTEATVKLDQLELDVTTSSDNAITIIIDLYFDYFRDQDNFNYENNSVVVQLFSDVADKNATNNEARIDYLFIYEPNITFSGSSKQETVLDNRNRSDSLLKDQRITIDKIGPRLSHTYTIDNTGLSSISNASVKISLPMQTKDFFSILYLFDKVRIKQNSQMKDMSINPYVKVGSKKYPCTLPSKYLNPLKIIGIEPHESHLSDIDMTEIDESSHSIKKRSVEQSTMDKSSKTENDNKIAQGKMHRIPVEIIQCNRPGVSLQTPICADIQCDIPLIPPNKQAQIQINAWLMAFTFFKKQISDNMIYTTLTISFGQLPSGVKFKPPKEVSFSQYQKFIFKNVKPKIIHIKPLWPIIVGIVIGILILAILIVAMYKCGFFKRHKNRRHFMSNKSKRNEPIIMHPADIQNASTTGTDARISSHSTLINSKND